MKTTSDESQAAPAEEPIALDDGTRRSLVRLSALIKNQGEASEAAATAAKSGEKHEAAKREEDEAKARLALTAGSVGDQIVKESLSRESYPAVQRVQSCFQEAARKRGAKAYSKSTPRQLVIAALLGLDGSSDKAA